MKTLWNIQLMNTGTGQEVYNENLPYLNSEPTNESIIDFMSLIRPTLRFDSIMFTLVGELDDFGRLKKQ